MVPEHEATNDRLNRGLTTNATAKKGQAEHV